MAQNDFVCEQDTGDGGVERRGNGGGHATGQGDAARGGGQAEDAETEFGCRGCVIDDGPLAAPAAARAERDGSDQRCDCCAAEGEGRGFAHAGLDDIGDAAGAAQWAPEIEDDADDDAATERADHWPPPGERREGGEDLFGGGAQPDPLDKTDGEAEGDAQRSADHAEQDGEQPEAGLLQGEKTRQMRADPALGDEIDLLGRFHRRRHGASWFGIKRTRLRCCVCICKATCRIQVVKS